MSSYRWWSRLRKSQCTSKSAWKIQGAGKDDDQQETSWFEWLTPLDSSGKGGFSLTGGVRKAGIGSKEAALSPIRVDVTMGFMAGGEIAFDVGSILLFFGLFSSWWPGGKKLPTTTWWTWKAYNFILPGYNYWTKQKHNQLYFVFL